MGDITGPGAAFGPTGPDPTLGPICLFCEEDMMGINIKVEQE